VVQLLCYRITFTEMPNERKRSIPRIEEMVFVHCVVVCLFSQQKTFHSDLIALPVVWANECVQVAQPEGVVIRKCKVH